MVDELTPEAMQYELGMKVVPIDIHEVSCLQRGVRGWYEGSGPGAVKFKAFEKEMLEAHKKINPGRADKAVDDQLRNIRRTAKAVKAIQQQFERQIANASVHRLNVFRCAYSVAFRHLSSQFELHAEVPHAKKDAHGTTVPGPRDWEYLSEFLAESLD